MGRHAMLLGVILSRGSRCQEKRERCVFSHVLKYLSQVQTSHPSVQFVVFKFCRLTVRFGVLLRMGKGCVVGWHAQVSAQRKRAVFGDLHSLFTHLDETQSGKITKDQFEQYASRSEVIAMFKVLDINVNDAIAFFDVLDIDQDEELDIEEFVIGCFRVQGGATAVNAHVLMEETNRIQRRTKEIGKAVEDRISRLEERMDYRLDNIIRAIGPSKENM